MRRSLEAGRDRAGRRGCAGHFVRCVQTPARVADHVRHPARARHAKALAVSDEEVGDAIRFAWEEHGLVVEPGGAVGAGRAARGQGRASPGYGGGAVGREYRPGAPRADRRERGLGGVPGLIFARLDMGRAGALDRPGQLLELGGERLAALRRGSGARLSATDSEASISVSSIIAMHGRIVSSIRSNASSRRACCSAFGMLANVDRVWLNLSENGTENGRSFIERDGLGDGRRDPARWLGVKLALDRQTRGRGFLMIAAAAVLVMNVMIWTV